MDGHPSVPLTPEQIPAWAQKAADLVEYCNAPNNGSNPGGGTDWAAVRAANGHPAPYNVRIWELDNETDHGTAALTVTEYIARCQTVIAAMRAIDPTIILMPHARTNLEQEANWEDWHQSVVAGLNGDVEVIAAHAYYDGIRVPRKITSVDMVAADADPLPVIVSEHGNWQDINDPSGDNATISGAVGTSGFIMGAAHRNHISSMTMHVLDGSGHWNVFAGASGAKQPRAVTSSHKLLWNAVKGAEIFNTTIHSPNNSGYGNGNPYSFDVRGMVARDPATGKTTVTWVNRHSSSYNAQVQIKTLPAGSVSSTLSYLSDPAKNPNYNYILPVQTSTPTINVTSSGGYGTFNLTLPAYSAGSLVLNAANSVPNITTTSLPGGTNGVAYNQALAATGGNGALVWSISAGSLPAGLSLSPGGVISGTPTTGGTANFTVKVADSDSVTGASDEDTQALSIVVSGGSTTVSMPLVAGEDGWVLESTETSNVGGSLAATGTGDAALRIGDDTAKKQFRTILSFDTSSIPDGATITAATLKVTRGIQSGNPSAFGAISVAIRTDGFNGNNALEAADFQAAATAAGVATMSYPASNGAVSTGTLNATGRNAINKTGRTQFRLAFATDGTADYLGLWPGEPRRPPTAPCSKSPINKIARARNSIRLMDITSARSPQRVRRPSAAARVSSAHHRAAPRPTHRPRLRRHLGLKSTNWTRGPSRRRDDR